MAAPSFLRLLHATADGVSDAELLRLYAVEKDEVAFELLVRRHADTVWTACRRILRNDADAEDAFQATFLALAKKAGTVREVGTLAGWLYRVAVNAALKLRARTTRFVALSPSRIDATTPPESCEPTGVACEELARLPDRFRIPVVLCDLEGYTHAEAAKLLGCPVGTVSSRLSRAHSRLKTRLLRRGVAAPAVLVSLTPAPALAARAAAGATGAVPVAPVVSTLTDGVLTAMCTFKLKVTAVVAAGLICLAGTGTYVAMGQSNTAQAQGQNLPSVVAVRANEARIRKVQKLKDGRLSAYPELVSEYSKEFKYPDAKVINGEIPPDAANIIAESDFRNLRIEQIRQLTKMLVLDQEVLKVGSWDVPFIDRFLISLESLQKAAVEAYPNPSNHIPLLRSCVARAAMLENAVNQRVSTAQNMRLQQFLQTDAARLRFESALYDAEVAAKKAAPTAGGR